MSVLLCDLDVTQISDDNIDDKTWTRHGQELSLVQLLSNSCKTLVKVLSRTRVRQDHLVILGLVH